MSHINPYQSPKYDDDPIDPYSLDNANCVWRDDNLLVMRKGAWLPNRCLKTNQPASGQRPRRTLYWHPPMSYLAILGICVFPPLLLVLLIAIFFMTEKAKVEIPVCRAWRTRCYCLRFLGSVLIIVGIFCFTFAGPNRSVFICLGVPLIVIGIVCGSIGSIQISAKRIDENYAWLKGVHPDYLAELPPWPPSI